jgi:hypothetical protein
MTAQKEMRERNNETAASGKVGGYGNGLQKHRLTLVSFLFPETGAALSTPFDFFGCSSSFLGACAGLLDFSVFCSVVGGAGASFGLLSLTSSLGCGSFGFDSSLVGSDFEGEGESPAAPGSNLKRSWPTETVSSSLARSSVILPAEGALTVTSIWGPKYQYRYKRCEDTNREGNDGRKTGM